MSEKARGVGSMLPRGNIPDRYMTLAKSGSSVPTISVIRWALRVPWLSCSALRLSAVPAMIRMYE